MKPRKQFACVTLFFLQLFTLHTASQYAYCRDFYSPMLIVVNSVVENVIRFPSQTFHYRSNQLCEWTISTDLEGYSIQLHITKCNLEGRSIDRQCNSDYVDVFDYKDGNPVFMNRFCGSDKGQTYQTTSNKITIRFHSNALFQYRGFEAVYKPVPAGPSEKESHSNIYALIVVIPAAFICLLVLFFIVKIKNRHFRILRNATSSPSPPAYTPTPASHDLQRGQTVSDISNPGGHINLQYSYGSTGPSSRDGPVETGTLISANEGGARQRRVTPPPAYDSLDLGTLEVDHSDVSVLPPPYELIVKQQENING